MIKTVPLVEVITRRLYWVSDKQPPNNPKIHVFCVDDSLAYVPYNNDFGPLDISMIYRYCCILNGLLGDKRYERMRIYHYTACVPAKRANSALLICAFQMLYLGKTSEQAWQPFSELPRFLPFRDSGIEGNKFELYIIDCLQALEKALALNWIDFSSFDLEEYRAYSQLSNGGFNWIVPEKLIAFPCPVIKRTINGLTPEEYSVVFENLRVSSVVRIGQATYDGVRFKKLKIRHYDVVFNEPYIPEQNTIRQFIEICRRENILAVHCSNGLGKSVTLIGCYVIKHYYFTGREFIAWARMCRPGSVVADQQYFLCQYYDSLYSKTVKLRNNSIFKEISKEKENASESAHTRRFQSTSVRSSATLVNLKTPANYRTRYNQLIAIDPLMIKLYGKNKTLL